MADDTSAQAIEFLKQWPGPLWVLTAIDPLSGAITTQTFTLASADKALAFVRMWNGKRNIYFSVNQPRTAMSRKAEKKDIHLSVASYVDLDPGDPPKAMTEPAALAEHYEKEQERLLGKLQAYNPLPSVVIFSGGGYQGFWLYKEPVEIDGPSDIARLESYNKKLEADLGGDHCHNIDRIMRLPWTMNIPNKKKQAKGRTPVLSGVVEANWEMRYSPLDFAYGGNKFEGKTRPKFEGEPEEEQPEPPPRQGLPEWCERLIANGPDPDGHYSYGGDRSKAVWAVCCELVRCGYSDAEIIEIILNGDNKISEHVLAQGKPQQYAERQAARARETAAPGHADTSAWETQWPAPLEAAAYHGLAGDIVWAIAPHSEADPIALLAQVLAAFGNCIGRNAHFRVEDDRHFTNMYVVLVGETSKARKGTSWGRVRRTFEEVDLAWIKERVVGGLSSGEGLIWAVRDPIIKMEDGEERITDPGVVDKRLLVLETEFAAMLKVMAREGNPLSQVIRDAWDRGNLSLLTKNSPARATDAHITSVGHCTVEELQRNLDATEVANGFANRIIFFCVRRSNVLPFGGNREKLNEVLRPLQERLKNARLHALNLGALTWDRAASELWKSVYPELSEGKSGMLGTITARAEAQVTRLALIYALLDCARWIGQPHLEAALALWRFSTASVKFIFGDVLGDEVADTILSALRGAGEKGLTRTAIAALFSRHKASSQIDRALALLARQRLATAEELKTGGRPTMLWRAVRI